MLHEAYRRLAERIFTVHDGDASITFTSGNATAIGLNHKALGYLYRRSIEYKYCEAKYGSVFRMAAGGAAPSMVDSAHWAEVPEAPFVEWGAIISAPFISWCGCHMLMWWRHDSTLLHLLSSLFVVNGISAALAHYWSETAWHRIDGMSMALTAWLACGFLFEEICENYYSSRKHLDRRSLWRLVAWVFMFLAPFWWLSETNGALTYVLGDWELGEHADFAIIAVPLVFTVIMAFLIIRNGWAVSMFVDPKILRQTNKLFIRGLCIALVGIISWVATEQLCDSVKWIRFIPGHFIWHITVSYGFTLMLLLGGVLRADNFKKKPRIWRPARHNNGKDCCHHGAYNFFTSLYFDIMPEFAHVDPELDASTGFERVALSAVHSVSKTANESSGRRLKRSQTAVLRLPMEMSSRLRDRLRPGGTRVAPRETNKASGTACSNESLDAVVPIDRVPGLDTGVLIDAVLPAASRLEDTQGQSKTLVEDDLEDEALDEDVALRSSSRPRPGPL